MNLYAYCVIDNAGAVEIESVRGLADARVTLLSYEGLTTVVSDFVGDVVSATGANVMGHERVVRHFLEHTTPLPFRFGSVVSKARLENYLRSQQTALKAQLQRVGGCVEMSVKVIWHRRATENLTSTAGAPGRQRDDQRHMGRGEAFLVSKRRELLGDQTHAAHVQKIGNWLNEGLHDSVRDVRISLYPNESLFLVTAHLVELKHLEVYRFRLAELIAERSDLHFLTSGPWPPYSFTDVTS